MTVRIKITAGGIFGAEGEIPIGSTFTLSEEPVAWRGRYVVLSDDAGKTAVVNPAGADELIAKHRGGGSYSVMKGDDEVLDKLAKDQAEAFNALSADEKALAIEYARAERAGA